MATTKSIVILDRVQDPPAPKPAEEPKSEPEQPKPAKAAK